MASIANIIANYLLIPKYGAAGAEASTCLSFWIFFILRTEFSIYLWKPQPRFILYVYASLVVIGPIINGLFGEQYTYELMSFWLLILASTAVVFKSEILEGKFWILRKLRVYKF